MENKQKPEPTYPCGWTIETQAKIIIMHKEGMEAILRTDLHNKSNLLIKFMSFTWKLMVDGHLYQDHCSIDGNKDKINWENINYIFNEIDFPKLTDYLLAEYKQKLDYFQHCSDIEDHIHEIWDGDWKHLYI